MQEFQIGSMKKLCFVVKKGEVKNIVVPHDNLADIDLKRFFDMEKQGGELMRVMRDTTLDNGVNALVMYADMLVDVDNPQAVKAKEVKEEKVTAKSESSDDEDKTEDEPKKERKSKGRGKKDEDKSK